MSHELKTRILNDDLMVYCTCHNKWAWDEESKREEMPDTVLEEAYSG